MNLYDLTEEMMKIGYEPDDARARVCQDIVLKALSLSPLSRNATIKGGVVMRSITDNVRRATQDMDIAFDNEGASLLINSRQCHSVKQLYGL